MDYSRSALCLRAACLTRLDRLVQPRLRTSDSEPGRGRGQRTRNKNSFINHGNENVTKTKLYHPVYTDQEEPRRKRSQVWAPPSPTECVAVLVVHGNPAPVRHVFTTASAGRAPAPFPGWLLRDMTSPWLSSLSQGSH